jgi:hypothetical protein
LAIIAAVIVLAVLGTVLALTLGGDDKGNESSSSGKGGTSASAGGASGDTGKGDASGKDQGQDPSGDQGKGKDKDKDNGKDDDSGKGSDNSGTESSDAVDSLPDGYKMVTNKQFHFTMAMPENFTRYKIAGSNSGQIYNVDGGFPRVQVDYNSSPGSDAAAAWNSLRGAVAASSDGYRHLGIREIEYNGYPTVADWQFERNEHGQVSRILNRGFKVDATHGYSIMVSCKAGEWNGEACRTLRETAFATFRPKD